MREILEETLRDEKVPDGVQLYDFGDGVTVMPEPDFKLGGSYLTNSIAFLWKNNGDDSSLFLGVRLPYIADKKPDKHRDLLRERLREALKEWPQKAMVVKRGGEMPRPYSIA